MPGEFSEVAQLVTPVCRHDAVLTEAVDDVRFKVAVHSFGPLQPNIAHFIAEQL